MERTGKERVIIMRRLGGRINMDNKGIPIRTPRKGARLGNRQIVAGQPALVVKAGKQEDFFMPKLPHTPEFRAKLAQEYLDGLSSIHSLSNKYHVGQTTLQEWVNQYQIHGISAFIIGNPDAKPIFHSDRGFQYTSKAFQKKLSF